MAIHILAVLEDTVINATRGDEGWILDVSDSLTGVGKTVVTSDKEFGAAMALAIGGDDIFEAANNGTLYDVAEDLMTALEITDEYAEAAKLKDPVVAVGTKVLRFIP